MKIRFLKIRLKNSDGRIHRLFALPKKKIAAYLCACFAFVFTVCLLSPLDIFLNNPNEFLIGFFDLLYPLALRSVTVFLLLALGAPIVVKGKGLDALTLLFIGITAAFYVQELFLNGKSGLLTGDKVDYNKSLQTFSYIAWVAVAGGPLCVWKGLDDNPKRDAVRFETPCVAAAVIILGMKLSGIIAVFPSYRATNAARQYLSYSESFKLSAKQNICVFLMDRLDVDYMNKVLEKKPELRGKLDGFTFYSNNISQFTNTFPSVTKMLTGADYNGTDSWEAYWEKAWSGRGYIDILIENGFISYLLPDKLTTYGNIEEIRTRAANLKTSESSPYVINRGAAAKTALKISASRMAPYAFKWPFIHDIYADFANDFIELTIDDYALPAVGNSSDIDFFNSIKNYGLSVRDDVKVFTFVHLNCAHDGNYRYDENADTLGKGGDYIESTIGAFAALERYFAEMKRLGVYDNSSIVIVADHGRALHAVQTDSDDIDIDGPVLAALLIKPENARGELKTDSAAQVSNEYFGASILEYAGAPRSEYGLSYNDVINGGVQTTRKLYLNWWRDYGNIAPKGYYEITGDASDYSNWKFVKHQR